VWRSRAGSGVCLEIVWSAPNGQSRVFEARSRGAVACKGTELWLLHLASYAPSPLPRRCNLQFGVWYRHSVCSSIVEKITQLISPRLVRKTGYEAGIGIPRLLGKASNTDVAQRRDNTSQCVSQSSGVGWAKPLYFGNSCKTPKPATFFGPVQAQGIRRFYTLPGRSRAGSGVRLEIVHGTKPLTQSKISEISGW